MFDVNVLREVFEARAATEDAESPYRGGYILFIREPNVRGYHTAGSVQPSSGVISLLYNSIRPSTPEEAIYTVGYLNCNEERGFLLSILKAAQGYRIYVFKHDTKSGLQQDETFLVNLMADDVSQEFLFLNLAFVQMKNRLEKIKDELL